MKNKKIIAALVVAVLIILLLIIELRFSGVTPKVVSTNEERILSEMPMVKISDDEYSAINTLTETSEFKKAYETLSEIKSEKALQKYGGIVLSGGEVIDAAIELIPENARLSEVWMYSPETTYVTYELENMMVIYSVSPVEKISVTKTVAVYEDTDPLQTLTSNCDVIYENKDNESFSKIKDRHLWFSWINTKR